MPLTIRQLTDEEAARAKKYGNRRSPEVDEYKEQLKSLAPNKLTEVAITPDEKRTTVKQRLIRAADELNMAAVFSRSSDETLLFKLVPKDQAPPKRTRSKK